MGSPPPSSAMNGFRTIRHDFHERPSRKRFGLAGLMNAGMSQTFLVCDREQAFLMPPSLRDWLPADHLAWFVIETVGGVDLSAFCSSYRADGHGRAACDPAMMAC
jgi:hypothetical protein